MIKHNESIEEHEVDVVGGESRFFPEADLFEPWREAITKVTCRASNKRGKLRRAVYPEPVEIGAKVEKGIAKTGLRRSGRRLDDDLVSAGRKTPVGRES